MRGALARAAGDQEDAPRGRPGGSTSTCSAIVPATRPVRSSGTTTVEQTTPGVVPHAAESRVRGRAGDERGQRRDENGRAETPAAGQCLASEQAEAL